MNRKEYYRVRKTFFFGEIKVVVKAAYPALVTRLKRKIIYSINEVSVTGQKAHQAGAYHRFLVA